MQGIEAAIAQVTLSRMDAAMGSKTEGALPARHSLENDRTPVTSNWHGKPDKLPLLEH